MALFDAVLVIASFMMLLFVRFNGAIPAKYSGQLFDFLPFIVAAHLTANYLFGVYGQIWKHASVAEARRVCLAGAAAGAFIFLANPMRDFPIPRSVALVGAFSAAVLMGFARFQVRLLGSRKQADRMATVPAKRFGIPDEFGAACAFLCSAQAGYITGQNLLIDGGAFPGAM